jgi:hypothetical protein
MKEEEKEYTEELRKAFKEMINEMFTKEELDIMEAKHQYLLKQKKEKPTHNED